MGWVVNATPRPLHLRERPGTNCIGGWVGPRAGLARCGKSRLPQGFDGRTVQPVASRYTEWMGESCKTQNFAYARWILCNSSDQCPRSKFAWAARFFSDLTLFLLRDFLQHEFSQANNHCFIAELILFLFFCVCHPVMLGKITRE